MTSDDALGLNGKYKALSDIKDGSVDKDLVGTWKTSDGTTTYVYGEDGICKSTTEAGDSEIKFTCMKIGEYNVVCDEVDMEDNDENATTTTE